MQSVSMLYLNSYVAHRLIKHLQDIVEAVEDEDNMEHEGSGRWPYRRFVEQLLHDMFDPGTFFLKQIISMTPHC